jgi:methyl-accepting chemotaxis protein
MATTFPFGVRNDRRNAALSSALATLATADQPKLDPLALADLDPAVAAALEMLAQRIAQQSSQEQLLVDQLKWMQQRHIDGWIYDAIDKQQFTGRLAEAAELVNVIVRAHIDVKMRVVEVVKAYAEDRFDVLMDRMPGEKAKITSAMDDVRERFKSSRDAQGEMLRVKTALDNVTTNAMVADENNIVVYVNGAINEMLVRTETQIRRDIPEFRAATVLGSPMDIFGAGFTRSRMSELRTTSRTEFELGGRIFAVMATPIVGAGGIRYGTVVEWVDRTDEVKAERETEAIVRAAASGDFARRLDPEGREGFFRIIAEQMNALLETAEVGLNDVVRVLSAIAKGDLTERIDGEYTGIFGRLKDDSNLTSESLTELILKIRSAVEQVNSAAREIALGNNDLSQRTEQQAASLEETASSMEELTGTVQQNAENARKANDLAIGARDIATKGGSVVGQVVDTMASINESAKKIVDIISVIDGIAFQTNILALNAAVEAARAGEQGRGFAVVAGEVRNLAQRSAAAAKEIKGLISDSVEKTNAGSRLVDQAGATMNEIVEAVRRVTEIMSDIAAASSEQRIGIEQVNRAVSQMESATQQNAALVEEASASAAALEEQAAELVSSIAVFRLDDRAEPDSSHHEVSPVAKRARPKNGRSKVLSQRRTPALQAATDEDDWKAF